MLAAAAVLGTALSGCTAPAPAAPAALAAPTAPAGPRVLATGLAHPWEILTGPDGHLWVTEKSAGRVTRIDPADGTRRTALTLPDLRYTRGGQDGLLGMALDLPHVYLAYTDRAGLKVVRYTYRSARLRRPVTLLTGLPVTNDHVSGRLRLGPDGKLYLTLGDGGHNQFGHYCEPNLAQELPRNAGDHARYPGKILRMNLDGSVPADNPVLAGVRSHVYSYGHRNAQGLAFGPTGLLYATEQGPKSDDELNLIRAGGDYGWPRVAGYRDDRAYAYANWSAAPSCRSITYDDLTVPAAVPRARETAYAGPRFVPPLRTFFTVPDGYVFERDNMRWPTIAPSGAEVHVAGGHTSVLIAALKTGTVYRVPLDAGGRSAGEPVPLWRTVNRYRDLAVDADGRTVYVATDPAGRTLDIAGRPAAAPADPGAILVFGMPV